MIRLLFLLVLMAFLISVAVSFLLSRTSSAAAAPGAHTEALLNKIEDLAWSHRQLDEGPLPDQIIDRFRRAELRPHEHPRGQIVGDVLDLARQDPAQSDLSVILIDTIRSARRHKRLD